MEDWADALHHVLASCGAALVGSQIENMGVLALYLLFCSAIIVISYYYYGR
jgi:hypothetical protein